MGKRRKQVHAECTVCEIARHRNATEDWFGSLANKEVMNPSRLHMGATTSQTPGQVLGYVDVTFHGCK
jgi:hypothetical protein